MSTLTLSRSQNTVLANAYNGLALLLLPSALGSYLAARVFSAEIAAHPIAFLIASIVALLGLLFATVKNSNSMAGFGFAMAFALALGATMGPSINHVVAKHYNGSDLVALAFIGTAVIFVSLASYVHITQKDFSGIGGILFAALCGLLIAGIANIFFQSNALSAICAGLGVAVFSGYILHDVSRAYHGHDDNWILVSLNLYLNVANLFMDLLRLFSFFGGSDD